MNAHAILASSDYKSEASRESMIFIEFLLLMSSIYKDYKSIVVDDIDEISRNFLNENISNLHLYRLKVVEDDLIYLDKSDTQAIENRHLYSIFISNELLGVFYLTEYEDKERIYVIEEGGFKILLEYLFE